ncbi:hypothetical protein MAR_014607 [Mya arenaria]|uniref:Uncharacterized protein n=1 Tax=Mya arenaria TaxID=6604 RepID=A0ABY7G373_MYAAR|nr:hypothetical protein MAR_014607 [Mya arenaria]
MDQFYNLPTPSPTRVKSVTAKRLILRRTQDHFRCACDQIILLNRRMEGVLFRYHAARANTNRGFRYKLRLRLAIVEGIRNMFYEYANRKASEIVNLRRELFGEIRLILRRTQDHFRCACDQIILLNKKMEGVLFRYHTARANTNRGFRYKLRLRLAIVEGIRNMFYEYANRKASEIVNLRRELFGEIVEIVSDDIGDQYFAGDDDRSYTDSELSENSEDLSESAEDLPENDEDLPEDPDDTTDNNEESMEIILQTANFQSDMIGIRDRQAPDFEAHAGSLPVRI